MKKFEIGKTYYATWICDSDSISTIKIVGRSAKMVTFERWGETRRARIYTDSNGEYITPDHYSMACVYRAERELLPDDTEVNPMPPVEYTVSRDLLAYGLLKASSGQIRQSDFLAAIVARATGISE
jgi:hypothetical protein